MSETFIADACIIYENFPEKKLREIQGISTKR